MTKGIRSEFETSEICLKKIIFAGERMWSVLYFSSFSSNFSVMLQTRQDRTQRHDDESYPSKKGIYIRLGAAMY